MIKVTEKAVKKLEELLANEKNAATKVLRISVGGFGWGGPSLQLTLDELNNEDDIVVESKGVKVVYDESIARFVTDSVIDYSASLFYRGFYIKREGLSSC